MSDQTKGNKKSKVIHVDSEKTWDLIILQANKLGLAVVVHFTATWCTPSTAMNPCFEELALANPFALFLSVDMDELLDLARKLRVKSMPTFLMIRNEVVVDMVVGANPQVISRRVTNFIHSSPIVRIY